MQIFRGTFFRPLWASVILLLAFTSCHKRPRAKLPASPTPSEINQNVDLPLIGFSVDTFAQERWKQDCNYFVQEANRLGARVKVLVANSDDVQQIKDIEALLAQGAKVLVVIPHNGDVMGRGVDLAKAVHVPVIAYDRIIKNASLNFFVNFDNDQIGRMQAQYLQDHMPRDGKLRIVRIYGPLTDNNAVLIKEGQDKILMPLIEEGKIEVVHENWAEDWSPSNAKRIVNVAFAQSREKIDAILASNDTTASGAIEALHDEGLAGKVMVTGMDADLDACRRIVQGTQSMTVYLPIPKLAQVAAQVAVDLMKGNPPPTDQYMFNGSANIPTKLIEVIAVTKDNMMETVVDSGFHTKEEIYGDHPAPTPNEER